MSLTFMLVAERVPVYSVEDYYCIIVYGNDDWLK
jgi:hypothetical protein